MIQTETLSLLEWPRLCQHLSTFAATKLGAIAARQLQLPAHQADSERLLAETQEAALLDQNPPGLKFTGIQDIGDALERAERQGILQGEELLSVATTLAGARQLRRTIDGFEAEELPTLSDLVSPLRTYPDLEKEIHYCIDDRGKVADRATPKLGGIRERLKTQRSEIYQKLNNIMQQHSNAIQEAVITQRGDRFVIPVKAPQKDAISGIVHDASTSGATLYVEPNSIVPMGNRLRQLQRQEQVEEEAICRALTQKVADIHDDLEDLLRIVTVLDLASARARYGYWLQANAPRFVDDGEQTTLRRLRHPLLVWQHQHEEGSEVVPIDIVVNPRTRVVAITGPNTGGKTVTLKTLGLAALMAKAGMFIPAKEPVEIPWFDQILADIGDEQSIEQSLSTFSGHIKRICRILASIQEQQDGHQASGIKAQALENESQALEDSRQALESMPSSAAANVLVLLDEVGAGTDPSEGSALAIALLRHLAEQARFTVATTHYGELKALKYEDERFENASVEFDDVSLSPTYRLLWGIPGRSNALTIARRLGLDDTVVEQAKTHVGLDRQQDVNQVIAGLEAQRKEQEEKADNAAGLLAETEKLHREVSRKAAFLQERERELQQQQEQAVQAAVAEARKEIARVIRRLQQGDASAQDAQKATEAVGTIAEKYQPKVEAPKSKPGYKPKEGDRVRIPSLGQTAEVLSDPDEDGRLMVRFGLMKMTVGLEDIESLHGEKAEPPKPKVTAPPPPSVQPEAPAVRTSRNTFDLRGMRVAEAETKLEEAIVSARGPIWIIHGHGTGKLRRGVQEYLKRHPQVQRFEAAEQADGGTGVTIAYF
ncbi:endonuclease MutS2 [Oscillatoria sp. CS-180]|uniref:endonuclease MutS2 n=1 Tax=Oscillatoria sp. CS-180 TaxID=3021720 RepID=UPI00232A8E6F|nr:endonuclease MutS2 [Oscillatoria sp. CS-180]MDB9526209.1 endonuclease MutS2 [Oscillatoria sp. CS-180]